jgi:hypothetical protein
VSRAHALATPPVTQAIITVGAVLTLAACGGAAEVPPASTAAKPAVSSFETLFPLEDGNIYAYTTKDGDETGMLVAKVKRTDATHGQLRLSNKTNKFVYAADGVTYDTGVYILKAPIAVGTSWQGEHGGIMKIGAVDLSVKVEAGSYSSCVRTDEEGGGLPPGKRYETTYCPGVGMVLLHVKAPVGEASATLKSYGKPVIIAQ